MGGLTREAKRLLAIVAAVIVAVALGVTALIAYRGRDPVARAEAFAAAGDWRAAQIVLRSAVADRPDSADMHLRMARLQIKVADPIAAEREYRRAVALGLDPAPLMPEIGEAILLQSRWADVLRLVPARGATPELAARNLLLRAIAQLATNDIPAAEATYKLAAAAAPDRPEPRLIAARIAAARNDLPATEREIAEVLKRDPNQVEALLMQEQLLTTKGDRPAALAMANRAVAAAPWSALARIDRAYQLMFAGQDTQAQADVDAVIAVQPLYVDAVYLSGILMARRGNYADAAVRLSQLDGVGARFPQAMYYQGKVAQAQNQLETAAEYARRYNLAVPRDPDGVRLRAETALAVQQGPQVLPIVEQAVAAGQSDPETLDLLGKLYLAAGNATAATETLRRAADAAPTNPAILGNLGVAELREGDAASALKVLEAAAARNPDIAAVWATMAQAALRAGDADKAEAALARLRALAGETETVGNLTGLVRMQRGDLEGARAAWAATLARFPGSTNAAFNTARLLVTQGRTYDATQVLRDILVREPGNLQVLRAYLELLGNDLPTAIRVLEAARKADPAQPVLAAMLADAFTGNGTPNAAIALLTQLRSGGMTAPILLPALARAQAADGQARAAADTFRDALAANPQDAAARLGLLATMRPGPDNDAMGAVLRAGVAAQPGDLTQMSNLVQFTLATQGLDAATALIAQLRADPANMPYAAALKGDLLLRINRPGEAAAAFAAELDPAPSLPLLMRLVLAQTRAGQDDAAGASLRTWLKEHPDAPDVARTLAQLDIKARRWPDAIQHLQSVLQTRPLDPQALNNLAWTYFASGDARARAAAQDAYLKAPSPSTADTLAWIMVAEGAPRAALPLLRTASAQRPQDATIRYHLAAALEADGQHDEALALLRDLLSHPAPFDEKDAAKTLLTKLTNP